MDNIRFLISIWGLVIVSAALGATIMYANLKSEGRILPKNECNDFDEEENII